MRKTTLFFILFQILDMGTTFVGLQMGLKEANPFGTIERLFICEIIVTVVVAIILQIKKNNRVDWAVPAVSGIIVPFNIFAIVGTLLTR